jgi:hypothetical protein
MVHALKT